MIACERHADDRTGRVGPALAVARAYLGADQ